MVKDPTPANASRSKPERMAEQRRATAIGAIAILIWSSLAVIVTFAAGLPPFELLTLSFAAAFALSVIVLALRGYRFSTEWRQPPAVWILGIGGLFGYHFFYFLALGTAPPVQASLINYLWPLLIVLFSGLLPNERLRLHHFAGAFLGFLGVVALTAGPGLAGFDNRYAAGYAAALLAAVIWASYSVASRRFGSVSSGIVSGYLGAVAILAALCHLAFEQTVVPDAGQWIAILALGAGPVGLAFFLWDHGMKHGSVPILGAGAYFAPLLSTALLIGFGQAKLNLDIALACTAIVAGALIAGRDILRRR